MALREYGRINTVNHKKSLHQNTATMQQPSKKVTQGKQKTDKDSFSNVEIKPVYSS